MNVPKATRVKRYSVKQRFLLPRGYRWLDHSDRLRKGDLAAMGDGWTLTVRRGSRVMSKRFYIRKKV